ncbi:hypothetical protein GGI21_003033, partial [Coemansia aciculifera]
MAPLARNLAITVVDSMVDLPMCTDRHRSILIKQLGQLADELEYNVYPKPLPLVMQPTGICEMIRYDKDRIDNSELAMQLAHCNALTLQSPTFMFCALNDITMLIQTADGSYVKYSRLHTLQPENTRDSWSTKQRPSHSGAIPFPSLQKLHIGRIYFFGDDTPFCSKNNTLEYLSMDLSLELVKVLMLLRYDAPNSHPKLQCVKIRQRSELVQDIFGSDEWFVQLALSIGPNAPMREIFNRPTAPLVWSVVLVLAEHSWIQSLELPLIVLQLWDVLALAKALPL